MTKESIRKRFNEEFFAQLDKASEPILKAFDSTSVQKFVNPDYLFEKHWTALISAQSMGHQYGLDFGCGTCAALILGKLLDMQVEGLDIIMCKKLGKSPFLQFQMNLKKDGYIIHLFDTDVLPWPISSQVYDFILCWDSFFTDWKEHIDWKYVNMFKCSHRAEQMNRILRKQGVLYVGGGSAIGLDIDYVKTVVMGLSKLTMQIYDWNMNGTQPA